MEKEKQENGRFGLIYPNSAAVDVGSMEMYVSMPNAEGTSTVKVFKAFTEDINGLVQELKQAQVTRVAMEATGVYWMAIFEMLEQAGLQVTLVNAHHFKNTDAQKTDVKDCQWLHQLHEHGLLRASHVALESYRQLRTYLHERNVLQKQKSDGLNRIQRALTQMNLKIQHLISDIEGVSGMKIIRAIANGTQDPYQLLSEVNVKALKATEGDLIKSLTGNYKEHHVQVVKRQLAMYDFIKQQMQEYEKLIEESLKKLLPVDEHGNKTAIPEKKSPHGKINTILTLKDI